MTGLVIFSSSTKIPMIALPLSDALYTGCVKLMTGGGGTDEKLNVIIQEQLQSSTTKAQKVYLTKNKLTATKRNLVLMTKNQDLVLQLTGHNK